MRHVPLRVVVAPDKLKGCCSAAAAAAALARGLRSALPGAVVEELPVADGGEGTLDALLAALGGSAREVTVAGPLGESVTARLGLLEDGRTAVVESAQAVALARVPVSQRDPLVATSRGVGELLRAALATGRPRVVVGLGGTATVDGGAGLLAALGARLLDGEGRELAPGGGALESLDRIDARGLLDLGRAELIVACDVDSPLLGPHGAARAFGPQKGADLAAVERLERGLARLVEVLRRDVLDARPRRDVSSGGADLAALPGAGAAGGLGAALAALGASLVPGAELVLEALELERRLAGADLVVTAEGALDATTLRGKATWAVLQRARRAGVPCVVVAGRIDPALRPALEGPGGFARVLELADGELPLEQRIARGVALLGETGVAIGRELAAERRA